MKWFRFHLSTMVAVTLVFGALLGLNLRPIHQTVRTDEYNGYKLQQTLFATTPIDQDFYGWPTTMFVREHAKGFKRVNIWAAKQVNWQEDEIIWTKVAVNAALAIALCMIITIVLERTARRRITKKSAAQSPIPSASGGV